MDERSTSDDIQAEFAATQKEWSEVLTEHRMAPPDHGFAARLSKLARVLRAEAVICRRAAAAGFGWPPTKADTPPPYELQRNTGRRGPLELWRRFDQALDQLTRAVGEPDLETVAAAFGKLGDITEELAVAVAREDAARTTTSSTQQRRSA
ncbi:MAG: hypothetical protein ABSG64_13040 [Solirubrobacteraceae bacterium]